MNMIKQLNYEIKNPNYSMLNEIPLQSMILFVEQIESQNYLSPFVE